MYVSNDAAFTPPPDPPAAPSSSPPPEPASGPVVRFAGLIGEFLAVGVEQLADESNRAAVRDWLSSTFRHARALPAEDVAAALIRAVGMGVATAKDVLDATLPPAGEGR